MKKLGAGFAVASVFLMIAIGCNSSANDSSSTGGANSSGGADSSVPVSNALVRQVQVGMTEQEVRDLLGEPDRLMPNMDANQAGWLYEYGWAGGTAVWFQDGKVLWLPWVDGKAQ